MWLNTFQINQDGLRLNRSAREQSVKRFDTVIYKDLFLPRVIVVDRYDLRVGENMTSYTMCQFNG